MADMENAVVVVPQTAEVEVVTTSTVYATGKRELHEIVADAPPPERRLRVTFADGEAVDLPLTERISAVTKG